MTLEFLRPDEAARAESRESEQPTVHIQVTGGPTKLRIAGEGAGEGAGLCNILSPFPSFLPDLARHRGEDMLHLPHYD